MRESLLEYLWCPECHGDLRLKDPRRAGRSVVSGRLDCAACSASFAIDRGVPDFVGADGDGDVEQTTKGFAGNWEKYNRTILANESLNRDLFDDWIWPLNPLSFEDKVVVEAGCGMGRWLRLAAEHRPKVLIGFDYSPVVHTAARNTAHLENVHVVRADIFRLPFRPVAEVSYSIGVVHHTPDPARAFSCLVDGLADDGVISCWVYGKENNGWIENVVDPVRKNVTSRLPPGILHALSGAAALQLRVMSEVYAAAGGAPLPYKDYLLHLREYPLNYMTHIVYDHLIPTLAAYLPKEELRRWAQDKGLAYVLSPRNGNSWRLFAGRHGKAVASAAAPLDLQRVYAEAEVALR